MCAWLPAALLLRWRGAWLDEDLNYQFGRHAAEDPIDGG